MLLNLKAEMARHRISVADIAGVVGRSYKSAQDKINGRTMFSVPEAMAVRDEIFPGLSLEYLFENERADDQGA